MESIVINALEKLKNISFNLPYKLRILAERVIDNSNFKKGYGSSKTGSHPHHNYAGGLVVHTAEVVETSLTTAATTGLISVSKDILILAGIYHDFAKIYDYDENGDDTEYKKLIRHLSGSYYEWMAACSENKFYGPEIIQVGHCILAHHGRKEWGSPVEPQTIEAQILHYSDMLSMQYGKGKNGIR